MSDQTEEVVQRLMGLAQQYADECTAFATMPGWASMESADRADDECLKAKSALESAIRAALAEPEETIRHMTAALREATEAPVFDPDAAAPEVPADTRDALRMDFLDTLTKRTEFQNSRRPSVPVKSDMHFGPGGVSLYVRNQTGDVVSSGSGASARDALDAAMAPTPSTPKDAA